MNSEFCIAVHSLVFLNRKACMVSSSELAKNVCTNPARVRMVMAKLKKAGIVSTKEGLEGGYHLELNPKDLSLYEISEALNFKFVSSSWKSGGIDMDCLIASGMGSVLEHIYEDLNDLCKERLKQIYIDDINNEITENYLNKETIGGNI
ncbi:RrF2 family transcriptional regulator [Kineothrix sp. MB12-C1]|uniref:RrF2 family transcriptional regulator n=1 Tax=Kineothrix sp. MB12-C1 TaxID=3070215 RepID=UPI0027D312B4|nr:Rrf2 family transcriptional regulator [Kineothrix sp. MB12-C1]WMC93744.1 Rrf2 family transcriptional regulator [Kineothrix sp. MB12-C1]